MQYLTPCLRRNGGRARGSYACPFLCGPGNSCLTHQVATLVRRPAVDVPTDGLVTSAMTPDFHPNLDPDPEPRPETLTLNLSHASCEHFIHAIRMLTQPCRRRVLG